MQSRSYSSGAYRFAFNGKEREADGTEGNYDFGARIYDGRLGRWLAVDPKFNNFPNSSCYIGLLNCPILLIDPNGKEVINGWTKLVKDAESKLSESKNKFVTKYESEEGQFHTCNLSSKKAFKESGGTLKEWRQFKKDKKEVERLEKKLEQAQQMEKETDMIISKFKETAPDLFNAINTAVSPLGKQIDALIYADNGKYTGGSNYGNTRYAYGENGELWSEDQTHSNAIDIYIDPDVNISEIDRATNQYSLQHEFGHFLFVVKYSTYIPKMKVLWPNSHESNGVEQSPNDQVADAMGQLKNPSKAQIEELLIKYKP